MNEYDLHMNDALDQRLAALTREAEPSEAVWQRLEQRLQPKPRVPWAARASAAVAVLAAAAVFWSIQPKLDLPGAPGVAETPVESIEWPLAAIESAGLLEPWQHNQRVIDELMTELERSPDHPVLVRFLADARQRHQELSLLALRRANSPASDGGQS
jgi:hypothetical protein